MAKLRFSKKKQLGKSFFDSIFGKILYWGLLMIESALTIFVGDAIVKFLTNHFFR